MKIYVVRHGQSEFNIHEGYFEKPDCNTLLTDKGKEQAYEAGKEFKAILDENGYKNIRVLVSPFVRAKQTFKEMNKHLGISEDNIFEEDMLVEHMYGAFHGYRNFELNELRYPEEFERYSIGEKKNTRYYNAKPAGESEFNVVQRAKVLIEALHRESKDDDIDTFILVTHHNFIRCFMKAFFRKSLDWYHKENGPGNCSIQLIDDGIYKGYIVGKQSDEWGI